MKYFELWQRFHRENQQSDFLLFSLMNEFYQQDNNENGYLRSFNEYINLKNYLIFFLTIPDKK
ncbi:MAG TPA: hypothetical protein DCG18_04285 [Richelia sp.]|jgi:hypothetical protein|nr:hypothetical protein [Richelia sp.]